MTIAVDLGRKATKQTNKQKHCNYINVSIIVLLVFFRRLIIAMPLPSAFTRGRLPGLSMLSINVLIQANTRPSSSESSIYLDLRISR